MGQSHVNKVDKGPKHEALMKATGEALVKYGVNELTTQKIANEWGQSQSLIHYYHNTKDDLLITYIEWLQTKQKRKYESQADEAPLERIRWFLNQGLGSLEASEREFSIAIFELHGIAATDERYRQALTGIEEDAKAFVRTAIQDGIKNGVFRPVNVDSVTMILLSAHDGGLLRSTALQRTSDGEQVHAGLVDYVKRVLLSDDVDMDSEWSDEN